MGLVSLLGLKDTFDGLSLPAYLNRLEEDRRVNAIVDQAVTEQREQDETDRRMMLAKVRSRMTNLYNEPDVERRHKHLDKYAEAEILLTRRIDDE
jgi:hypothetical protein